MSVNGKHDGMRKFHDLESMHVFGGLRPKLGKLGGGGRRTGSFLEIDLPGIHHRVSRVDLRWMQDSTLTLESSVLIPSRHQSASCQAKFQVSAVQRCTRVTLSLGPFPHLAMIAAPALSPEKPRVPAVMTAQHPRHTPGKDGPCLRSASCAGHARTKWLAGSVSAAAYFLTKASTGFESQLVSTPGYGSASGLRLPSAPGCPHLNLRWPVSQHLADLPFQNKPYVSKTGQSPSNIALARHVIPARRHDRCTSTIRRRSTSACNRDRRAQNTFDPRLAKPACVVGLRLVLAVHGRSGSQHMSAQLHPPPRWRQRVPGETTPAGNQTVSPELRLLRATVVPISTLQASQRRRRPHGVCAHTGAQLG